MKWDVRFAALALALSAAGLSGCLAAAGAAAGVGTYAYTRGSLATTMPASLDDTWEATLSAAERLGLQITERKKDELGAHLVATQAQGPDVTISLEPSGGDSTKVSVRVGVFGDEQKSRTLLREIQTSL